MCSLAVQLLATILCSECPSQRGIASHKKILPEHFRHHIILLYCILYIVINNCQHHPTLANPMAHNQNVVCGSKVQLDLLVDC